MFIVGYVPLSRERGRSDGGVSVAHSRALRPLPATRPPITPQMRDEAATGRYLLCHRSTFPSPPCLLAGWCGVGYEYCGAGCQPLYGDCDGVTSPFTTHSPFPSPSPIKSNSAGGTGQPSPHPSASSGSPAATASSPGGPPPPTVCGNRLCENPHLGLGETCGTCPVDCGPCQVVQDVTQCKEALKWALTIGDGPSPISASMLAQIASTGEHVGLPASGLRLASEIRGGGAD
jgi:hypothetical protein